MGRLMRVAEVIGTFDEEGERESIGLVSLEQAVSGEKRENLVI